MAGSIVERMTWQATSGGHRRLTQIGPVGYGKAGSFEGMCSGAGIAEIAKDQSDGKSCFRWGTPAKLCPDTESLETLTAKVIADAAKAGDPFAKEIFAISGEYLGAALAVLVDILNPEVIVCGRVLTRSYELIWDSAIGILRKEALGRSLDVCRIVKSGLGESIGDFAALSIVLNEGC